MALAFFNGQMERSIMENGEITRCTAKVNSDGPMAEYIMESMSMTRNMEKAFIRGQMVECTKANFIMVNSMVKAFIAKIMVRKFTESGKKVRKSRYSRASKSLWKSNNSSL